MNFLKLLPLTLLSLALLFGCAANQNDEATNNNDQNNNPEDVGFNPDNGNVNNTDNGNMNNTDNGNANNTDGDQPRIEVADEATKKITELDDVKSANILVTDQNAFVAVVLDNGAKGEVRAQLKDEISNKVKETDKDIDNVYVSSNPDFVERMNDYANRVNEGDPIEGLFDEFNETVRRVFPDVQ
ncbi:YhcN/YlaJ family sporulation lipoprotein [Metabacillus arenae]|uniref:YhcN/YlaJ family sporulation lipoprotein n=1 Tax=Metabacillus arenae TaxID=2771434 RepID=A0A926RZJ4_9BACI|nr:YhcN/YlaJ family sporulation lipoprotein [Metabacillus arenae]MBD1382322.1 YhcN/YlaJ family sporulation lipoprotein [Metabacillus arenae]